MLVLMTSGHCLGGIVAAYANILAGPVITLLIMGVGLMIMLRGLGWQARGRYHQYSRYNRYGRGWHGDRW